MSQLEKLLARIRQIVQENPDGIFTVQFAVKAGIPILWAIHPPVGVEGFKTEIGGTSVASVASAENDV